jgi:protein tyrosine phosphatase (PTP) superfamily phosphohydrolase (DUF442 family)
MKKRAIPTGLFLALVLLGFPGPLAAQATLPRPALWASAVLGTSVQNLYRVDQELFRSAQPNAAGFRELEALGVKSVLDVAGGDGDDNSSRGTKLKLFHVPMSAFGLRDARVLEALRILTDPQNRPVVIHCQHGADRTGAIVALYRVVVQGWTKEDAIREMDEGGFHHSSLFRNLDRYVLAANVEALRRKLGVTLPAPSSPANSPVIALAAAPAPAPTTASASSTAPAPAMPGPAASGANQ